MKLELLLPTVLTLAATTTEALAAKHGCDFKDTSGQGGVDITAPAVRLVARLIDPPRSRVTLSIDDKSGNHHELVWDPAVNDGLQHSILLQGTADKATPHTWTFSPFSEEERIQTGQVLVVITTVFAPKASGGSMNNDELTLTGTRNQMTATVTTLTPKTELESKPRIQLSCETGQVEISSLRLDSRRVAAAATARGLLDQAAPAPLTEALSLLAEIAVERAKSGAMQLMLKKLIEPMCSKLTLSNLGLPGTSIALPQTCALLQQMRIDDVLSSGKSLVAAARDDLRFTILPRLIDTIINDIAANDETRELARTALQFANRMIDGESSTVVGVDVLVSVLDHLGWSHGFERSQSIVLQWLGNLHLTDSALDGVLRTSLGRALPAAFWDDPASPFFHIAACKRRYKELDGWVVSNGKFPDGPWTRPDRGKCLDALIRTLLPSAPGNRPRDAAAVVKNAINAKYMKLEDVVTALRQHASTGLAQYLLTAYHQNNARNATDTLLRQLPEEARYALKNACAVRLAVGIAKWCSGRDACSAGDVADVMDNPRKIFKPTDKLPESMCWVTNPAGTPSSSDQERYLFPTSFSVFYDLAVRLVAFLTPPAKSEERTRALAMARWLFAVVRALNLDDLVANPLQRTERLADLERLVGNLVEGDYLRALASAFTLVEPSCPDDEAKCKEVKQAIKKALELFGVVASYVQTYEATKTLDAEAARKARKKAIERLIDSTTERGGRDGDVVWSIGSPVGFAGGARLSAGDDADYRSRLRAYDLAPGFQWRVPLAIARQRLPQKDGGCGSHFGLWIADLGQFARSRPAGTTDDISWRDFLGIGLQGGLLLGTSDHAAVLAVEASWAPGLFARDVTIQTSTGPRIEDVSGAFTLGLTLAYYVPFFDLN